MKKDECWQCDENGQVYIECCSRCNELHYIGECQVCAGIADTNYKMIKQRCEETNGYLCGYDPKAYN